jgi:hypothetical protein
MRRIGLRFVGFRLHCFSVSHPEIAYVARDGLFGTANGRAKHIRVSNCPTKCGGQFCLPDSLIDLPLFYAQDPCSRWAAPGAGRPCPVVGIIRPSGFTPNLIRILPKPAT